MQSIRRSTIHKHRLKNEVMSLEAWENLKGQVKRMKKRKRKYQPCFRLDDGHNDRCCADNPAGEDCLNAATEIFHKFREQFLQKNA